VFDLILFEDSPTTDIMLSMEADDRPVEMWELINSIVTWVEGVVEVEGFGDTITASYLKPTQRVAHFFGVTRKMAADFPFDCAFDLGCLVGSGLENVRATPFSANFITASRTGSCFPYGVAYRNIWLLPVWGTKTGSPLLSWLDLGMSVRG
jgi:hypothetical protein